MVHLDMTASDSAISKLLVEVEAHLSITIRYNADRASCRLTGRRRQDLYLVSRMRLPHKYDILWVGCVT